MWRSLLRVLPPSPRPSPEGHGGERVVKIGSFDGRGGCLDLTPNTHGLLSKDSNFSGKWTGRRSSSALLGLQFSWGQVWPADQPETSQEDEGKKTLRGSLPWCTPDTSMEEIPNYWDDPADCGPGQMCWEDMKEKVGTDLKAAWTLNGFLYLLKGVWAQLLTNHGLTGRLYR